MSAANQTDQLRLDIEDAQAILAEARDMCGVPLQRIASVIARIDKAQPRPSDYDNIMELTAAHKNMTRLRDKLAGLHKMIEDIRGKQK